jgi:NAD(P)-dependent dehydrogenase (short-subunit alcohol dehydrogenase family)
VSTDLTSAAAIADALKQAAAKWGSGSSTLPIAAAVYNAGGQFKRAPFLELTEADFALGLTSGATAGFNFAQATLPGLLAYADATGCSAGPKKGASAPEQHSAEHPPTLIFTGATASVKGSANFASFAAAKHALRAMAQSLAREFMPKGVHIAHAIIDGVIDIPRTKQWDVLGKLDPEAIADSYWALHAQPKTAWTWEIDVRPWVEKW